MRALPLAFLVAVAATASANDAGVGKVSAYPADDEGCASAERALRARYSVSNVTCQPSLYKTSYPPKLLLTYTRDGQVHSEYVTAPAVRAADSSRKSAPNPNAAAPRKAATPD